MAKLVTAIFRNRSSAMLAVEDLIRHGFPQDDISVLMSETTRGREFFVQEFTKSPEGLCIGAAIGGLLGTACLGLTSTGLLAIPGADFYAAGQWISMLAGFGAGALCGGLIGGLVGLTMPEHEAQLNPGKAERGGILLGVYVPTVERAREAHNLMAATGAVQIHDEKVKSDTVEKKRAA